MLSTDTIRSIRNLPGALQPSSTVATVPRTPPAPEPVAADVGQFMQNDVSKASQDSRAGRVAAMVATYQTSLQPRHAERMAKTLEANGLAFARPAFAQARPASPAVEPVASDDSESETPEESPAEASIPSAGLGRWSGVAYGGVGNGLGRPESPRPRPAVPSGPGWLGSLHPPAPHYV